MPMTKKSPRLFCHFTSRCSAHGPQTHSRCTEDVPYSNSLLPGHNRTGSNCSGQQYRIQMPGCIRPTPEENRCSSHFFCSSESCSVSSFLLSSPPASSLPFPPSNTFRILQSARELMKNSSTISSEVNLWIEETLI